MGPWEDVGIEHLAIEIIRYVGEGIEDAGFVGDGSWFDVDVIEVLFL